MSWAHRVVALVCLVVMLSGCGRGGILAGALLVRVALVAVVLASEGDHADAYEPSREEPTIGPVDLSAVDGVLTAAMERVRGCGYGQPGGPQGQGVAHVLVEPSGEIIEVVLGAPFAGTGVGQCISDEILASAVKPYEGDALVFRKGFVVD